MDYSLPGSFGRGVLQAGILEWAAITSSWLPSSPPDSSDPGIEPVSPVSPAVAGGFFTTELLGKPRSI